MSRSGGNGCRREIVGVPFDFVTKDYVLETIEHWRRTGQRQYIEVNNPNAVMCCWRDPTMMHATRQAGIALPDGVGVVLAALMLGYYRQHRVTGPSLMLHLCDRGRSRGYRHYLFGGKPGVAERLTACMTERFPGLQIVGHYSPPFRNDVEREDRDVIERINATRPDIVWVGLGCPKQEKWMLEHRGVIHAPAMIGVGAAFDYHSGAVQWAPRWVRAAGLEWLYRLCLDPKRMIDRNVRGLHFATIVGAHTLRNHLLQKEVPVARPDGPIIESWVTRRLHRVLEVVAQKAIAADTAAQRTPSPIRLPAIEDLAPARHRDLPPSCTESAESQGVRSSLAVANN